MEHSHHDHHHEHPVEPIQHQVTGAGNLYVCPMHPDVIRSSPGKCPKCGMDLVPMNKTIHSSPSDNSAKAANKHAGHHTHDFLKRFWICLVITIPILLLSPMIRQWFGFHFDLPGSKYVLLVLSTFIYGYGGWPFLKGLVGEVKGNAIGMMTLVAIAITVAYSYSVAIVLGLNGMDFFWELATLIDIMLLGHWLEMRSQQSASRALQSLVALLPSVVHVNRQGVMIDIALDDLQINEIALIKPGEKIPADGEVIDGTKSACKKNDWTTSDWRIHQWRRLPYRKNLSDRQRKLSQQSHHIGDFCPGFQIKNSKPG